jgi:hypothetical protein
MGAHKRSPVSLRLPQGDEAWLRDYAKRTGKPVNQILAELVASLRAAEEPAA